MKRSVHYPAAKAGDRPSAYRLVRAALAARTVASLTAVFEDPASIWWLPVVAVEAEGINRIPAALANGIRAGIGGSIWDDVVQSNAVGHTGASGWERLARPALFEGNVLADARYVLVDDFVGQGGTFANLRGYVVARGGNVVGAVALTGQRRSAALRLGAATLDALESKHGTALETLWTRWFGYGLEYLTESEARYLLRAEDVDTIRNRLLAARS